MTTRIVTDANGRKHITNEPLLHPPQRTWVGLTDEEICIEAMKKDQQSIGFIKGAEWAEAKLKELNNA